MQQRKERHRLLALPPSSSIVGLGNAQLHSWVRSAGPTPYLHPETAAPTAWAEMLVIWAAAPWLLLPQPLSVRPRVDQCFWAAVVRARERRGRGSYGCTCCFLRLTRRCKHKKVEVNRAVHCIVYVVTTADLHLDTNNGYTVVTKTLRLGMFSLTVCSSRHAIAHRSTGHGRLAATHPGSARTVLHRCIVRDRWGVTHATRPGYYCALHGFYSH